MTLRLLVSVLVVAVTLACKTAEPRPSLEGPVEIAASGPAVSVAPGVELPAPPPLPAAPFGFKELDGPEDNPTTAEKVELGWMLFFDQRLSGDGSMACVECHQLEKAYASGNILDGTVSGVTNRRNSPSVLNVGYQTTFAWDGRLQTLESACDTFWRTQLDANPAEVAQVLNDVPVYRAMFVRAFGAPATPQSIPRALAAFLRELKNGNSPWDRFHAGDTHAMSKEAQEGSRLFVSKGCGNCHLPPLFADDDFHNVGVGDDPGRKAVSGAEVDRGKLRTPSLRNVALTAPYFHDGHATTLDDALALMLKGGNPNPRLDANLKPRKATAAEVKALKAFLESLSGQSTFGRRPTLP
jgi:cytochrome c peroxidase